ncbi:1,2-phenylacetyl-CoA epoxidase subunit PaaC [Cohaesibacter gelatinilyticus]|nr:1,2-phenylacetyl-CoA epoxidase subunit PaaC [Cohaesibacter gelatinilyticus]
MTETFMSDALFKYLVRLADDTVILSHRLGEWCGHASHIEEDVAMTNISLDLIGQARNLYSYAAEVEGKGRDEDQLAYLRNEREFTNLILVEQPNGDFGKTMARQLLYSAFMLPFWEAMMASKDKQLAAIAAKAEKEVTYHLRHAAEWTIRLGDGTPESHRRMQEGIDELWMYTGELFVKDEVEERLIEAGIAIDPESLRGAWERTIEEVLTRATLKRPEDGWMHVGGRNGVHTEHLGHALSDFQYLQRAYPDCTW